MAEPAKAPGLRSEVARLGRGSLTYFLAMVVTRGLNLLLTPLYVRFMSPDDYGIVGFASSLVPALALLFALSAHSAASRLYYSTPEGVERQRLVGSVLLFLLVVPPALAVGLEILGSTGMLSFFRTVPYTPYLRIVVWTSLLVVYTGTALNMLVILEQHRRAAYLNAATVILTAAFTVLLVVVLRMGATGQLLATLFMNIVLGFISIRILWKIAPPVFDRKLTRIALLTSLPLVPHELMKWGLASSDRLILERYVTAAALGNYALGYTFGNAVGMIASAMIYAFMPMVNRKLGEGDPHKEVPPLGTIVILATSFVALGAAVALPPAIRLVAPASYHGGAAVVPWVALALYFQNLYSVFSMGTVFSRRTGSVAIVTFIGAGANVGLNFLLVPRYGIIAAAITTAIGYALMALLHTLLAWKLFPIDWEYGRVARIGLAGLVAYAGARLLTPFGQMVELFAGGIVATMVFVLMLALTRAVRAQEVRVVREFIAARRARV